MVQSLRVLRNHFIIKHNNTSKIYLSRQVQNGIAIRTQPKKESGTPKKKEAMAQKKTTRKRGVSTGQFILNCDPSESTENDWTFEDALDSGIVRLRKRLPTSRDLRTSWWKINNQGSTGACVGFATAYGAVL